MDDGGGGGGNSGEDLDVNLVSRCFVFYAAIQEKIMIVLLLMVVVAAHMLLKWHAKKGLLALRPPRDTGAVSIQVFCVDFPPHCARATRGF